MPLVLLGVGRGREGTLTGEDANGMWGPQSSCCCLIVSVLFCERVLHVAELLRDVAISGPDNRLQHTQVTPPVVLRPKLDFTLFGNPIDI